MSNVFFMSDTHFGSAKVIDKCQRPFSSSKEMDEVLLDRINSRVGKRDVLYHLGDFSNAPVDEAVKTRDRIRCKNVFLVAGNHDEHTRVKRRFRRRFLKVKDFLEVKFGDQMVVMCHYPHRVWHHWDKRSMHLHGHCHGYIPDTAMHHLCLDVGVDCHGFSPLSYAEVLGKLAPRFAAYDGMEVNEKTW